MLVIGLTAYTYHHKWSQKKESGLVSDKQGGITIEKPAALNVNPANTITPKPSGLLDPVPAKLKWKVEIKNRFHPRMFLFNESLLIVNTTDGMVAVDTADGTIKWQSNDAYSRAQYKGLIYYDGPRNQVCCMNPANQQVLWRADLGDFQKIWVKDSTVVTQSHPDNICVFDANSGRKKWSVRGDDYSWEPSIVNNIIYFASEDNDLVEGLGLQTGKRIWFFKPNRNIARAFEVMDGVLYFCFWEDMIGLVSAIDMDKKVKWKTPVNKSTDDYHEDAWFYHKPIIVDDTILILVDIDAKFNGRYKSLIAIDRNTGDILWRSNVSMRNKPIVADRTVYFISGRGLIALDLRTGIEKWTFQSDDLRLGVYDALILASNDGTLYVCDSVCLYSIHTR